MTESIRKDKKQKEIVFVEGSQEQADRLKSPNEKKYPANLISDNELTEPEKWQNDTIGSSTGIHLTNTIETSNLSGLSNHAQNAEEPKNLNSDCLKDKTILLAEDEKINTYYIQAVLQDLGINIVTAVNGLEAVELCNENAEISLVLMDIKMPEMDGLTATRKIKLFRQNLPVIATTAYYLSSDKQKCLEAGCIDYLPKPIKKDQLIDMIKKYLCPYAVS